MRSSAVHVSGTNFIPAYAVMETASTGQIFGGRMIPAESGRSYKSKKTAVHAVWGDDVYRKRGYDYHIITGDHWQAKYWREKVW